MPTPILVIDHGFAIAKACIFDDTNYRAFRIPLGFKASEHLSVLESVVFLLKEVEKESGVKIVGRGGKPRIPVYISGEIASVELTEFLGDSPFESVDSLRAFDASVVDVGSNFTFVRLLDDTISTGRLQEGLVSREKLLANDVLCWLPFRTSLNEVENYIRNKELYLQVLPTSNRELYFEQAIAREKLRLVGNVIEEESLYDFESFGRRENLEPQDILLSGGVLSGVPRYEQAVYIFLDGTNLPGVFKLFLDEDQVVSCLGTLKRFNKNAAERVLRSHKFVSLGTVVSLGTIDSSRSGVKVTIDLGLKTPQEMLVEEGDLLLFPLAPGDKAQVAIEVGKKDAFSCEVEGGEVGLVIDSRGKPLERPPVGSIGLEFLKKWDKQMNVHGQVDEI